MRKFLVVYLISLFNIAIMGQSYKFVSIENSVKQQIAANIISEVYKKMNIDILITPLPPKRAKTIAGNGIADGEIMRIFSYGESSPTVIRVPTPYYIGDTTAFVKKDSGVVINSMDDLKNYRLGRVRGIIHSNKISDGFKNVLDIHNSKQMFHLLKTGQIEVALFGSVEGLFALKNLGLTDIIQIEKQLAVFDLYHYIHKKNTDLVPKVDAVIKELITSGEMVSIIKKAEDQFIGN